MDTAMNTLNGDLTKDKKYRKILGKKMKRLRLLKGVTQMEVAYAIGYESTGMLSKVEAGDSGMSYEQIFKAAEYFGVPPLVLMSPQDLNNEQLTMIINFMKLIRNKDNPHYQSIRSLLENATK